MGLWEKGDRFWLRATVLFQRLSSWCLFFFLLAMKQKGKSDTSSNHAVLKLAKGDEVWLRMGTVLFMGTTSASLPLQASALQTK